MVAYCFLLVFMLLPVLKAHAQEPYEIESRRQRAIKSQEAADRESARINAESNRPSDTKWGSATGVFGSVTTNARAKAQEAAAARDRAIYEKIKQDTKVREANLTSFAAVRAPYERRFEASGLFSEAEARDITLLTITTDIDSYNPGAPKLTQYGPFHLNAITSYGKFYAQAATASFEDLVRWALEFRVAGAKSVAALQSLSARFPSRQTEIDKALFVALQGRYGGKGFQCNECRNAEGYRMDSLFYALAAKYPVEAGVAVDTGYHMSIYRKKIEDLRRAGKSKEAELLKAQEAYLTLPTLDIRNRIWLSTEFLATKDLAYFTALTAKSGQEPFNVLLSGQYSYTLKEAQLWERNLSSYYAPTAKDPLTPWAGNMVYQMALSGKPEAMNVYGLRTVHGWTNEDAMRGVEWLQKAQAAGNPEAKENLEKICKYEIKGLKNWCKGK